MRGFGAPPPQHRHRRHQHGFPCDKTTNQPRRNMYLLRLPGWHVYECESNQLQSESCMQLVISAVHLTTYLPWAHHNYLRYASFQSVKHITRFCFREDLS